MECSYYNFAAEGSNNTTPVSYIASSAADTPSCAVKPQHALRRPPYLDETNVAKREREGARLLLLPNALTPGEHHDRHQRTVAGTRPEHLPSSCSPRGRRGEGGRCPRHLQGHAPAPGEGGGQPFCAWRGRSRSEGSACVMGAVSKGERSSERGAHTTRGGSQRPQIGRAHV